MVGRSVRPPPGAGPAADAPAGTSPRHGSPASRSRGSRRGSAPPRSSTRGEVVDERRHDRRARHVAQPGRKQSPRAPTDARRRAVKRGDDVAPEAGRIVVVLVQGEPGDRRRFRRPGRPRRLAGSSSRSPAASRPGRGPTTLRRRSARPGARPRDQVRADAWDRDLGREEVIVHGAAGRCRHGGRRFGHAVTPARETIRRVTEAR